MRKMTVLLVVGFALVVVFAAGAFACGGLWKAVGIRYDDDYSSTAAITEIHVTGKTVAATVRTGSGTGVEIHRTVRYLNYFHERPAETHAISGSVLELRGDDSSTFSSIEYVVLVPAGYRVTADIGTGSLEAAGVSGADVRVSTGSIKVTDATGDVHAEAGTGAIAIDLATPENVEAKTGTGSVAVTVPAATYRVDASSGMGSVNVGIPNDPNGAYLLTLRSNLGSVTLATAL